MNNRMNNRRKQAELASRGQAQRVLHPATVRRLADALIVDPEARR